MADKPDRRAIATAYVDQMSAVLPLAVPPDIREGVITNFERIWEVAQPVLEFPLPEDLEAAPTFKP